MRTSSLFSTIAGLSLLATAYAAPTFVSGVTESSGWYDCNKRAGWVWEGGKTPSQFYSYFVDDIKMCWAHAASNILQWWQDKQPSNLIPNGTPNGLASTATPYTASSGLVGSTKTYYDTLYVQQLAIFQDIAAHWSNTAGTVKRAYNWYFNGGEDALLGPTGAYLGTASDGGYYADLGLSLNSDGVTSPLFTSENFFQNKDKAGVYSVLQSYIDRDYGTTLSIGESGAGHAISMWGYEMDGEDMIVYLTDSDDLKHTLFKQKVLVDDYKNIYLTSLEGEADVYSNNYTYVTIEGVEYASLTGAQIGEVQGFIGAALVPEPSSSILTLLGGLVLLRRRRR
ncbi:MAG: PEP-CTERM sorting domain-containing protein [Akkermansia sp.]|nr:PEP-CTERM sorting domain-containing protein [Akkermansia sp.]